MSVTFFPARWGINQLPDIGRSGLIEHGRSMSSAMSSGLSFIALAIVLAAIIMKM